MKLFSTSSILFPYGNFEGIRIGVTEAGILYKIKANEFLNIQIYTLQLLNRRKKNTQENKAFTSGPNYTLPGKPRLFSLLNIMEGRNSSFS
jgi:hypothetical protein